MFKTIELKTAAAALRMPHKKLIMGVIGIISVLMICLLSHNRAFAANATIEFEADKMIAKAGDTITVTMTISTGDGELGDIDAFIAYNSSVLEYVSNTKKISGNSGLLMLRDIAKESGGAKKEYKLQFKALAAGVSTVEISGGRAEVMNFTDKTLMTTSFDSISVAVGAAADASNDNTLKSLKLSPGKLDQEFDPEILSYRVTLPYSDEFIVFSAIPNDNTATVEIKGNEDLVVGWNHPKITVTAESGKIREYEFSVYRQSEKETQDAQGKDLIEELVSSDNFKVLNDDGTKIIQSQYAYQLVDLEDSSKIPTGYQKTSMKIFDSISIPVYTLSNNVNSDYLLIYASDASGVPQFYQFDKVEKTIQRYNGNLRDTVSRNDAVEMTADEYSQKLNNFAIIIAVLASLLAMLLVLSVKLLIKVRGISSDELD